MSSTTTIELCTDNTADHLHSTINKVIGSGAKSLLILACDADNWLPEQVDAMLQSLSIPVIGGGFPSLIYQGQHLEQGTLVVGLDETFNVTIISNLSQNNADLEEKIRSHGEGIVGADNLILIVDALAGNIERFVEGLYSVTGVGCNTVGAGAGSLDFIQKPCLFTNTGLIQDAAIVAAYPKKLHSGINHGWEILDGPYLVTNSCGNILETLNYTPAFEVYRSRVEKASGLGFENNDFFSIAKTYPLGIENLGGDIVVRDPVRLEGYGLVCLGEVPENAMVYILKGQADDLIASAGNAAKIARDSYTASGAEPVPSAMIFDCFSRGLFLGENFACELESIEKQLGRHNIAFGALTLGEIINTQSGPIGLLNKSTVIAVF